MREELGVSLTELLISLFLSSLLMALLMQHYLASKRQFHSFQTRLEQRFDEQLISDFIQRSVRSAGFTPCRGVDHLTTRDSRTDNRRLVAMETGVGKYHAFKLNRMSEVYFPVSKVLSPFKLLIEGKMSLEINRPVLIADCFHGEVHVIKSIQKTYQGLVITLKKTLAFDYRPVFYIGAWVEEQFYIKQNPRGNAALYYETVHQEALSSRFKQLSTSVIKEKNGVLLRITLLSLDDKPLILETKMRTP